MSGLFGNLTWNDFALIPLFQDPNLNNIIAGGATAAVILGGLAVVVLLTVMRWWGPLWRDWLTTMDHKRIGIMYIVVALVMFARALAEAIVMRMQQMMAVGSDGFLSSEHFGELFTTHGTIMIFFVAMPILAGLMNYVMPLQLGARDVSFPMMNAVSLMFTIAGAALTMVSLVLGKFGTGGWTMYPPYAEIQFSPGVGVDYWIWAVTLAGIGTTLTGVNFIVTILRMRAPGMKLMHMPLFSWSTFCTAILMVFAMPPLTVAALMLALDRYFGFHFFTNDAGGDMMNYANLFWLFGHPEVYILVLPAFGVYSEVFQTFSGKRIYGYTSLVWATMAIGVLSFTVWLHHFFTMGSSANVNAAFGIATMLIGVPTGVKIYDWLLTMVYGRVRIRTPMLFSTYFLLTFVIGGATGILLANPPVDFSTHNTLFLVAHFHNVIIPGVLFASFAAIQLWFPKAFGYRLDEKWGRISFWLWAPGFLLAFMPLYVIGLGGAPRRSMSLDNPDFQPWVIVAFIGALLLGLGLLATIIQYGVSFIKRKELAVPLGDPWDARTLEWFSPSPPFEWNFSVNPVVTERDQFAAMKEAGTAYASPTHYEDVHMPKNSAAAPIIGLFATIFGFAFVWSIWWAVILGFVGGFAVLIFRSFVRDTGKIIPASEIKAANEAWLAAVNAAPAIPRRLEVTSQNLGKAEVVK